MWQPDDFTVAGGKPGVLKHMLDLNEDIFPGRQKTTEVLEVQYKHFRVLSLTHGPKLPRRSKELRMWSVGDGSTVVLGTGVEAAAGAGVMGAREILRS